MGRPLDIEALYARHRDEVLRFFVRRTADPEVALDLWAETFAQAVAGRKRCRARTPEAQSAWLWGIVHRQFARFLRRGYAEQRALLRLGLERPPANEDLLRAVAARAGLAQVRAALSEALHGISSDARQALELRVIDELPYAEVARRLDITETAARARVSRALHALAATIDTQIVLEARRA